MLVLTKVNSTKILHEKRVRSCHITFVCTTDLFTSFGRYQRNILYSQTSSLSDSSFYMPEIYVHSVILMRIWRKTPVLKAKKVVAVLSSLPVQENLECKPQLQDYPRRGLPGEQAVGLTQAAAREKNITSDSGKTANAKHRCSLEYLFGTGENRLLLCVREISSDV